MKIKTSELIGPALDWAVAKCEWVINGDDLDIGFIRERGYTPSTDWAQGGSIIERENLGVWWDGVWHAKYDGCRPDQVQDAGTPLIAAMRCYVASKLGEDVDIPEELK